LGTESRTTQATRFIPGADYFRLGFAGPRKLGNGAASSERDRQLDRALEAALRDLRARLDPERPLCAVGSLALGADLRAARVLLVQGAALRIWLPEPLDRFLNEDDFPDPAARTLAAELVAHPCVAELRVVSSAPDRRERFYECAAAVVRDCDAMLCVRHWEPSRGRGGTEDSVALCAALGRPLIEIRLPADEQAAAQVRFPPELPERSDAERSAAVLPFPQPDPAAAVARWKTEASAQAHRSKNLIVQSAAWKVGLQLFSTLIAVVTLGRLEWEVVSLLLKTSVILLVAGITVVSARRATARRWARQRFTAELLRSWSAVRGLSGSAPWFEEDLPVEFAALGRDLAVMHGLERETRLNDTPESFRDRYVSQRIGGQQEYARAASRWAQRRLRALTSFFHFCLVVTLVALLTKLGLRWFGDPSQWTALDGVCSLVSILGPTLGAAAVSFVALLDLPARRDAQTGLEEFLEAQRLALGKSPDWSSVRGVVLATERRFLSEVKDWYARHAYRR
jgi:hypothetical protein